MGRRGKASIFRGILAGILCYLVWGGGEALAWHGSFPSTADCLKCHDVSSTGGDPNTSYISRANYFLQNMKLNNSNATPDTLGCTVCHGYSGNAVMKNSYLSLTSGASVHPVDFPYIIDANRNAGIDFLSADQQKNIFLSNWDNSSRSFPNQIHCVQCHDVTLDNAAYPNHSVLWTDNTATVPVAGSVRYSNPFMLRNVDSTNTTYSWSGGKPQGHAPDDFCLKTCHGRTAPASAEWKMGHLGWGAYDNTAGGMPSNTIKEPSGTSLKTSKCVDCHETHTSKAEENLFGQKTKQLDSQSNSLISENDCLTVCHSDTAFNATKHKTSAIQPLVCTSCHNAAVSHRDPANPRRLGAVPDVNLSGLSQNLRGNGRDDNYDGVIDDANENTVRNSFESICRTCHSTYVGHNGSINQWPTHSGRASCLDCHDPHGKGVFINGDNNVKMIRASIVGKAQQYRSRADLWTTGGGGLCDNPTCHGGKPMGTNALENGSIMGDVSNHRAANVTYSTDCMSCHNHTDPAGSFKPTCNGCHDYPDQPHISTSHKLSPVHAIHVADPSNPTPFAKTGYKYTCSVCHVSYTHNKPGWSSGAQWDNSVAQADVTFDLAVNPGASYNATNHRCSGLTCHGSALPPATQGSNTTPAWDNAATGACGTCHWSTNANPPASAAHNVHANANSLQGYNVLCNVCHYDTTNSGVSIVSPSERTNHVNPAAMMKVDVTWNLADSRVGSAVPYDNAVKRCSNVYCHSQGTSQAAPFDNGVGGWPIWTTPGPLQCNACHGSAADNSGMPAYPNGNPKINTHAKHIAMGYGCQACHVQTTQTGTTIRGDLSPRRHANGTYEAFSDNAAHAFTYATPNCSNIACHGTNGAAWGGAALQCGSCHLAGADSDQYQTQSNTWFANDTTGTLDNTEWVYSGHGKDPLQSYDVSGHPGAGFISRSNGGDPCFYCHDASVAHRLPGNPFRLKSQTAVSGYANAGWNATCLVCHSKTQPPPGYSPSIGYTTIAADNNDRVDTAHYGGKHATDNTSGGYFCWDCHDPHGDRRDPATGNIYMIQKVALAKTDGTYGYRGLSGENTALVAFQKDNTIQTGGDWARSDFRGICQACHHGNGAGSTTQAKYYAQSAFQSHNQDKLCTDCHNHDKNFGAACTGCHGETAGGGGAPPFAPFSSHPWASRVTVDNVSVAAGIGNHRTVPAAGIDNSSHEPFACSECHTASPGSDLLHDTGKDNATLTQISARHGWSWAGGPLAASYSYGALPGASAGGSVNDDSCSNVDCHSPRYGGNAARSGSTTPYTRYWINVTQWDCYTCHGYDGKTATNRPGGAASARLGTGSHARHLADNVSLACTACHVNNGTNVRHKNGGVDFAFPAFGPYASTRTYSRNGAVPTDNVSAYGSCSNVYCHSIVQTSTGGALTDNDTSQFKTAVWGNASSGQCGACHGNDPNTAGGTGAMMSSGSHQKHIDNAAQYRFACVFCHNGGGEGSPLHADGFIKVALSGSMPFAAVTGSYNGDNVAGNSNFGKCTVTYCHGTGTPSLTGGVNQMSTDNATWGSAGTGSCGTCHGAPGGASKGASNFPTSGAHARHVLDNTIGPNPSLACTVCHTSETVSSHVNGRVDFRTAWDNAAATDKAGTRVCDPCHGSGIATAKGNWDNVAAVDCLTCHGSTPAYTYPDGTGRVAPNMGGDNGTYGATVTGHGRPSGPFPGSGNPAANQPCDACHKLTLQHINGVADNSYAGNRLSDNVNGVAGLSAVADLCKACHAAGAGASPATKKKINTHGNAGYTARLEAVFTELSCVQCHEPHGMVNVAAAPAGVNLWMINPTVTVKATAPAVTVSPVRLFSKTGANSFNSYDPGAGNENSAVLYTANANDELCVVCHANGSNPGSPMTRNIAGRHAAPAYTGNEAGKDCSGCHSHDQDDNVSTVDGLMPLACNACHSYPGISGGTFQRTMSAVHAKHVGTPAGTSNSRGYECTACHYNYNHNQAVVTPGGAWTNYNPALHLNIAFDNTLNRRNANGPQYNGVATPAFGNGGTGACSGLYCHGSSGADSLGTGAVNQSTWGGTTAATPPKWDNSVTASCGSCHNASAGMPQGNHPVHIDNASRAYGPETPQFSAGGNCAEGTGCHTKYGLTPNDNHVNGTVDFRTSLSVATPTGLALTQVCRNCHSTYANAGNYLPSSGDTLVRTKANWDNGTYQVPCITCHNDSALAVPQSQGTVRMDGSGNKAPNILAAYYGNGHGASSIDNISTASIPPIPCMTCHYEQGGHIGAGKTAANPWRLDNALTKYAVTGGLDNYCMTACHANAAPAKHAWIVNGVGASAKDNTIRQTHPVSTEAVPQAGAPLAETLDKSRWYQVTPDTLMPLGGTSVSPASGDLNSEPIPPRLPTSYGRLVMCVTCHDPHGVGTAPIVPRTFSGTNDIGFKMLRYKPSGVVPTPLCAKCHK